MLFLNINLVQLLCVRHAPPSFNLPTGRRFNFSGASFSSFPCWEGWGWREREWREGKRGEERGGRSIRHTQPGVSQYRSVDQRHDASPRCELWTSKQDLSNRDTRQSKYLFVLFLIFRSAYYIVIRAATIPVSSVVLSTQWLFLFLFTKIFVFILRENWIYDAVETLAKNTCLVAL